MATITITPTADTYVQFDKPDLNFGTSVRWSVEGRTNIWRNALLRFDVVIPDGEQVVSATLRAYSEAAVPAGEFVDVYKLPDNTWSETGVTWNNAPARGTWLDKKGDFAIDAWIEWDVTEGVVNGTCSFKLETNAQRWVGFHSKEHTSFQPTLILVTEPALPPETEAGILHNWGNVLAGDEFNYTGAPDPAKWNVYDSAGHAGNGLRSPSQVTVGDGHCTFQGTANGTTGGMSAKFSNQKYGRWETRMRASGDTEYHMVAILWPDSEDWPCDGEIDYAETTGSFSTVHFFNHYSCSNLQTQGSMAIDVTQWHNYAVDWSPAGIKGYIDGVLWFEDNDPTHQPPGSMHQTLQLDWFPDASADGTATMDVEWVRVYAPADVEEPPPATGSFKFAAVGDMNPSGNTSSSSHSGKNAASIIASLNSGEIENFLGLGDFQYDKGTCSTLNSQWGALWGAAKAKTFWIAGPNHDYQPGENEDFDDFMNGQCGTLGKSATNTYLNRFHSALEWYSFDKGNWHILAAPTAVWRYNSSRANAMTAEMNANLAAARAAGKHLMVLMHDPYFTSNTSSHSRFSQAKPWIDVFSANKVRIILSGSQHNYERSHPVNKDDVQVADGMQQFQVSTGGIGLRSFSSQPSYIAKRFSDTWGHLRMELFENGSYSWEFRPVSGGMQTDSGFRAAP
jgi:hypothetical protein